MNKIRVIDWNISMVGKVEPKIKFIEEYIEEGKPTIIVLQEVTERSFINIKAALKGFNSEFSLEYRPSGRHEGRNRELGICILYSKEFKLIYGGLLDRLPFPERSLQLTVEIFHREINVIGFHSITGCSYKELRQLNF